MNNTYFCTICDQKSLVVKTSLTLAPDRSNDERILQIIQCLQCGFEGIALYEESRHGSLTSESWRHFGYEISESKLKEIKELMENKKADVELSKYTDKPVKIFIIQ